MLTYLLHWNGAPAFSTVENWATEFMRGIENRKRDPRYGHPASAATAAAIDRVQHMLMIDC